MLSYVKFKTFKILDKLLADCLYQLILPTTELEYSI